MTPDCPVCKGREWTERIGADVLRMESVLRAQFVFDRVPRTPSASERKDLTDFAHGAEARLLQCLCCSALIREDSQEPLATYTEDSYDRQVMERLFPRYTAAFSAKEKPYRDYLAAGAKVVEVGPHLGGFLQTARNWGWNPTGVDIGKDTAGFANSRGLTTLNCTLEDCRFPAGSVDAVFIWNCFEQLPAPGEILAESRRILKPDSLLVLRVPNAAYYLACRDYLDHAADPQLITWVTRALAYSNLLGWPYLHGYDDSHLDALAEPQGFRREAALNSELIILPFPDLPESIIQDKNASLATVRSLQQFERLDAEGRLTGPWIEVIYRAGG